MHQALLDEMPKRAASVIDLELDLDMFGERHSVLSIDNDSPVDQHPRSHIAFNEIPQFE